jgi:hypothetical protein
LSRNQLLSLEVPLLARLNYQQMEVKLQPLYLLFIVTTQSSGARLSCDQSAAGLVILLLETHDPLQIMQFHRMLASLVVRRHLMNMVMTASKQLSRMYKGVNMQFVWIASMKTTTLIFIVKVIFLVKKG